jgi:flagellar P-ring protein precursor FlgI
MNTRVEFQKNKASNTRVLAFSLIILLLTGQAMGAGESRIKDLASVQGTTPQQLIGYGLVTGLNGTGDGGGAELTHNSIAAMLEKLGTTVPDNLKSDNVAAVTVTCTLDPNAPEGSQVDVVVSSLLGASSLEGGVLAMTPLENHQGILSVMAFGSISIGGFNIKAGAGNSFRKNHSQVGTIPNGGTVMVELGGTFVTDNKVSWLLRHADFNTASEMAQAINNSFGPGQARAKSSGLVEVSIPQEFVDNPVMFVAQVGEITARSDAPARVVLNERTGTIVVGKNVRLKEAAVAHGTLKVVVSTYYDVSQPSSFSRAGDTVVVPDVNTNVTDKEAQVLRVPDTSTVSDVVGVLNEIGASSRDIIAILEALKRAGSLQAELVVM